MKFKTWLQNCYFPYTSSFSLTQCLYSDWNTQYILHFYFHFMVLSLPRMVFLMTSSWIPTHHLRPSFNHIPSSGVFSYFPTWYVSCLSALLTPPHPLTSTFPVVSADTLAVVLTEVALAWLGIRNTSLWGLLLPAYLPWYSLCNFNRSLANDTTEHVSIIIYWR